MARSLAATWAIAVAFFSLEVLRCFSSLGSRRATYGFSDGRLGITPAGFPHSGILGSKPACGSPRLIAASHALHRFLAPRHPPFALSSLTTTSLPTYGEHRLATLENQRIRLSKSRAARGRHILNRGSIAFRLVEMTGVEPATPCLQSRCSPN